MWRVFVRVGEELELDVLLSGRLWVMEESVGVGGPQVVALELLQHFVETFVPVPSWCKQMAMSYYNVH